MPNCPWGIVSNFVSFRLYHRDKTSQAYQEFRLQDLRKPEVFAQFYCLFAAGAFMPGYAGQEPRALRLIKSTAERQRDVGNELYEAYSNSRHKLIDHLKAEHGKTLDRAIKIAQTILDRIIFIAFCEDRGLLSENCLRNTHDSISPHSRVTNPRWQNFLNLFGAIDRGVATDPFLKTGFNGGLFKHDPEIDDLQLDDRFTDFFKNVGTFDFRDEVNLEVLGQLFEKSIGELESVRSGGLFGEGNGNSGIAKPAKRKKTKPENGVEQPTMQKSAERKRFGIYYTPPAFTEFIVRETLGTLIDDEQKGVRKTRHIRDVDLNSETPALGTEGYWRECLARLRQF